MQKYEAKLLVQNMQSNSFFLLWTWPHMSHNTYSEAVITKLEMKWFHFMNSALQTLLQ